jgi:hypothetical protein
MTRRPIAAAAQLLLAVMAAVLFWPDTLTAEEAPFVGVWRWRAKRGQNTRSVGTLTFTADQPL